MQYTCTSPALACSKFVCRRRRAGSIAVQKENFLSSDFASAQHCSLLVLTVRCGWATITSFCVDFTDFGAGVPVSSLATFAGF